MEKNLQKIAQDFLARIEDKLPKGKAVRPFVIAMIGMPGSGRGMVAKRIVSFLTGAVLVSSNSARYLLKEVGLPWGENVRQVLRGVATELLGRGYGVVFDGNAADEKDRENIQAIADKRGAKVFYIRINIDPATAEEREKAQYDNPNWISSFENFRVNTTEKMLANINERVKLHASLKSSDIPGLIGEIDNNGTIAKLKRQVDELAQKIKDSI